MFTMSSHSRSPSDILSGRLPPWSLDIYITILQFSMAYVIMFICFIIKYKFVNKWR